MIEKPISWVSHTRSNPRSTNSQSTLFVILTSINSSFYALQPFITGTPPFSRYECTEYSSNESKAQGWSNLCNISQLHALQRSCSLCSASARAIGISTEANGFCDEEITPCSNLTGTAISGDDVICCYLWCYINIHPSLFENITCLIP